MDVDDIAASPGAPSDDVDEFVLREVKNITLTEQRVRQVAFEQEKERLRNARKARDDEIRRIQEETRQRLGELERENAADATKERRLEANHHAAMRKLSRWQEVSVVDLQRSAPGVVSGFPFAMC